MTVAPDIETRIRQSFAAQTLMATLGAELVSVEDGRAVIAAPVLLAGLLEGFHSGAFGIGLALLRLVTTDARTLRRLIGKQAEHLNEIAGEKRHRERVGHRPIEIIAGIGTGSLVALIVYQLAAFF